jgi:hypothetical protein
MTPTLPSRDEIKADTPLRLSVAAALAFPDGSMTASGLRRECARGRFVVERIAGKQFTTLTHIEEMRRLCRVLSKELASTSEPNAAMWSETSPTTPPGSSAISSQMAQTSLRSLLPSCQSRAFAQRKTTKIFRLPHRKRSSTPSLTLKFLCAGALNARSHCLNQSVVANVLPIPTPTV